VSAVGSGHRSLPAAIGARCSENPDLCEVISTAV